MVNSISSGKRKNARWFPFLEVSLPEGDLNQGGYKWIEGVTLEDCENVSRQVSAFLDVEDVVPAEYELQVSSPGLDRKFYKQSDYQKFLGRLVRVKTSRPVRGLHVIVGKLKEYDGQNIVVSDPAVKKNPDYQIPLADIKEARLEVEI